MASNGGKRPGAGRKPKAEELKIVNTAIEAIENRYGSLREGFEALLGTGEPSLIKWVFEHAAGKPKEKIDVTSNGETVGQVQEVIVKDFSKK